MVALGCKTNPYPLLIGRVNFVGGSSGTNLRGPLPTATYANASDTLQCYKLPSLMYASGWCPRNGLLVYSADIDAGHVIQFQNSQIAYL
jgi:hypothetical protein